MKSTYRLYWLPWTVAAPARARQAIPASCGSTIGRGRTSRLFRRRIIGRHERKPSTAAVNRRTP